MPRRSKISGRLLSAGFVWGAVTEQYEVLRRRVLSRRIAGDENGKPRNKFGGAGIFRKLIGYPSDVSRRLRTRLRKTSHCSVAAPPVKSS